MKIEPKVLKMIGEVLMSGSLDPDTAVADQEKVFLQQGVCGIDLLDTLMAIEYARVNFSLELQRLIAAEFECWSARTIQSCWQPILDALQHQNQKK